MYTYVLDTLDLLIMLIFKIFVCLCRMDTNRVSPVGSVGVCDNKSEVENRIECNPPIRSIPVGEELMTTPTSLPGQTGADMTFLLPEPNSTTGEDSLNLESSMASYVSGYDPTH